MKNLIGERNSGCGSQSSLAYLPANGQVFWAQLPLAQAVSMAYRLKVSERRPWC